MDADRHADRPATAPNGGQDRIPTTAADRDEVVKGVLSEVYARMHGMFTSSTAYDTALLLELLAAQGYAVVPLQAVVGNAVPEGVRARVERD